MVIGVLVAAAVGLVLGLIANPPTAWFAVIELSVPGAFVGAIIGLTAGLILYRHSPREDPTERLLTEPARCHARAGISIVK